MTPSFLRRQYKLLVASFPTGTDLYLQSEKKVSLLRDSNVTGNFSYMHSLPNRIPPSLASWDEALLVTLE